MESTIEGVDSPPRPPVSRLALAVAFCAVVVGGLAGGAIGFGLVSIECEGDCGTPTGLGTLVGALGGAAGTAVVAVLVLRALAEWRLGGNRS
ncbi:MAG: hypothetical protein ACRDY7_08790 [Acidimicrobiia bacterium]